MTSLDRVGHYSSTQKLLFYFWSPPFSGDIFNSVLIFTVCAITTVYHVENFISSYLPRSFSVTLGPRQFPTAIAKRQFKHNQIRRMSLINAAVAGYRDESLLPCIHILLMLYTALTVVEVSAPQPRLLHLYCIYTVVMPPFRPWLYYTATAAKGKGLSRRISLTCAFAAGVVGHFCKKNKIKWGCRVKSHFSVLPPSAVTPDSWH